MILAKNLESQRPSTFTTESHCKEQFFQNSCLVAKGACGALTAKHDVDYQKHHVLERCKGLGEGQRAPHYDPRRRHRKAAGRGHEGEQRGRKEQRPHYYAITISLPLSLFFACHHAHFNFFKLKGFYVPESS